MSGAGAAWRVAQALGVLLTGALVWGLFVAPEVALNALWNVTIPLLPASFLVSTALWRNACPLATLNLWSNGLVSRRPLTGRLITTSGIVGIALLGALVPARRFVFNTDGTALAIVIALVATAAFALGAFFDVKAGFCNAICPVLPVERLYGQEPLAAVGNPRCDPCTLCTTQGCVDLGPRDSIARTLGPAAESHRWLTTGYGGFAAAFPGFVVGYYTLQDGPLDTAGTVYLTVAAWALGSYALTQVVVRSLGVGSAAAMPILATLAVALYYWFAAPVMAAGLGISDSGTVAIRAAGLALVAFWTMRGSLRRRASAGARAGGSPGPANRD